MTRLRKVDFQPLADKAAGSLLGWRGRNLTNAGKVTLTKSVLSSQPVYLLTVINAPKEVLRTIDGYMKCFLWAGDESLTGAKCKIYWPTVGRPTDLGGLGVLNLEKFARALRLCWLWQEWACPNKPWVGLGNPCSDTDHLLFAASIATSIGDGAKTSFWHAAWVQGQRPKDFAPAIFDISRKKNRTLKEAFAENTWIKDISLHAPFTVVCLQQFVQLWSFVQATVLRQGTEDKITWSLTESGDYSSSSAYCAQFIGSTTFNLKQLILKPWGPPKCIFFAWLIIRNRVWTSDRLEAQNWPRNPSCTLCRHAPETAHHILVEC